MLKRSTGRSDSIGLNSGNDQVARARDNWVARVRVWIGDTAVNRIAFELRNGDCHTFGKAGGALQPDWELQPDADEHPTKVQQRWRPRVCDVHNKPRSDEGIQGEQGKEGKRC